MPIPPHIFREYDIRGVVDEDLDSDVATEVGRAYASALRERVDGPASVVVGRDNRPSSDALASGLVAGLTSAGVDVVDIGTVPTPMVYWAERVLGTDGGVQITGSHNPPEWNGIKMTVGGGSLYGDAIRGLRDRIEAGSYVAGSGSTRRRDVFDDYVTDLTSRVRLSRPVRVVADCGNGSASLVAGRLLRAVGADVTTLFCESDGTFPNHHPDPTVDAYLVDLVDEVRRADAELGIAFDGDGDRLGVVDENGGVVRGDLLLLLFGLDVLERLGPGQPLVFDVKCSQALPEVYAQAGGTPIMWKTGHSLIKEKMREVQAPVAGELSGHICFADDYYGFDDALYDACRLLDLVARSPVGLAERVAAFPQYVSTPEIRVEVPEASKFEIVDRALEHFRASHDVVDVDGARILFDDGWALLRASNTQPVLVARYEARSEESLDVIREEMTRWLRGEGVHV